MAAAVRHKLPKVGAGEVFKIGLHRAPGLTAAQQHQMFVRPRRFAFGVARRPTFFPPRQCLLLDMSDGSVGVSYGLIIAACDRGDPVILVDFGECPRDGSTRDHEV